MCLPHLPYFIGFHNWEWDLFKSYNNNIAGVMDTSIITVEMFATYYNNIA